MKMKTKFALFALMTLIGNIVILLVVSLFLREFEADFKSFDEAGVRIDRETLVVARDTNYLSRLTRSIMLGDSFNDNLASMDKTIESMKKAFANMRNATSVISERPQRENMLKLIDSAETDSIAFVGDARQRMQALSSIDRTPETLRSAWAEYQKAATPLANKARDSFKSLSEEAATLQKQSRENTERSLKTVGSTLFLVISFVLVTSLVFIFMLIRSILLTVNDACTVAEQIASGDLSAKNIRVSNDELGHMLQAMQAMQEKLRDVVSRIGQVAEQLGGAAHGLQETTDSVRNQSEAQAEATSEMAATIEELTTSINHVAQTAQQSNSLASEACQLSADGVTAVQHTVTEIHGISASVNQAAELMQTLNTRSADIATIVGVIKEIAEQTNLLALNASIEAARAGEQGRGFAVVADEVRKLAERTSHSTHEISNIVTGIQDAAAQVVGQMQDGTTSVAKGVAQAEAASEAINRLGDSADGAASATTEITNALQEQAEASTQIARSVEHIAQMTDKNSTAIGQVAQAARELQKIATTLRESIAYFRK